MSAASSWHPPKAQIAEVLAEHGYTRWQPPHGVGGMLFERNTDGGYQLLFVFTWSNFRYSQESRVFVRPIGVKERPQITSAGQRLPFAYQELIECTEDTWPTDGRAALSQLVAAHTWK